MAVNSQFAVAIHTLTLLADVTGDEPITSEYIAGSVNTNPVFIRRILGRLSKAGLVASHPGVGGGWRLLRAPDAITLLDVYHAIEPEGHLLAMHHSQPNTKCPIGRNISRVLQVYFGEAEEAFEQKLAQRTITQVLRMAHQQAELVNQPGEPL
ncbi:Rrf2 family protein [Thermosporothrix hazakensis]|jgi:Rrf2 family protein|uniref:Rrf2 family protein n=2 Tax=Thermosporothrix TaxID=768650 RepID=A0A326U1N9_THEHA|nr:Rrf2 family transcriptional regulator [Thermosporothrix hazakensis]PZW23601.1 Rrf2 family protein [Thermosporothrix hazakensis]BBH86730.1 Rrf2 family transcriptional regulator [Thermosporothrix sp. COM3]GCE51032.1 Rrf2 family transcriptional regulator [Thermosporothrix hazakensis]